MLYPTTIGDEPHDSFDSRDQWQRVMQGHAAANMIPVVASNRIGSEKSDTGLQTFYGSSFIADATGEKLAEAPRDKQAVLTASFDLDELRTQRASSGLFRDRRTDLYQSLMTLDGRSGPERPGGR